MGSRGISIAAALMTVISLSVPQASALDRADGDHWIYDVQMYFQGIAVSGSCRYEMVGHDAVSVGPDSYGVDVIEVSGNMYGETEDFMGVSASVEVVLHGFTYDVQGGLATVKEDTYMWANLSIGTGSVAIVTTMESQHVTTYAPPALSGFVDGETAAGDEWDEVTNVTGTSTSWVDGVVEETDSYEVQEAYSCTVATSEETVTTGAGTFRCLRLTVTDSGGDQVVYWHSPDVGAWVKASMYSQGESEPHTSLELAEYERSDDSMFPILVLVSVGVLLAVVAVAVMSMLLRRRGQAPTEVPPPPPPPVG